MYELMPHQIEDAHQMVRTGNGLNYSKPGTGKTLTALNAFGVAGMSNGLIIAPPLALSMWAGEINKFLGMSSAVLYGGKSPIVGEPDFVITTYSLAAASQNERITEYFSQRGDTGMAMILDESHLVKSREAKRTKAVFGPACTGRRGLFDLVDQTWSLTGTPITRYADDMWAQLRATHPEVLRSYGVETYEKFVSAFCITQLKQHHPRQRPRLEVVRNKNEDILRELIYQACGAVRRTIEEIKDDMPPITVRYLDVDNAELRRQARALKEVNVTEGLETQDEGVMTAWREMGMAKLSEAVDYIAESAVQGPVLAGYWFTEFGLSLAAELQRLGLRVAIVNGATPGHKRDMIREQFNAGGYDVLAGQISAMNTSWNIQEASSHIIMAEDHFSPGTVEQFYKRVYRLGQTSHCQLDFLKARNHPIDDALTSVRARKEKSNEAILD